MTAQASLDTPSLYTSVGERLDELISPFGLDSQRETIREAYELLCRRSLDVSAGRRPLHGSRLNEDGTPFQLALSLAGSTARLQFISDIGPLSAGNAERGAAVRRCLPRIARALGTPMWVSHLSEVLDELAPQDDPDLLADDSGPAWVGVSFAAGRPGSLKIYINARWGSEISQWARLAAFAEIARVTRRWRDVRARTAELEPLGVSLTVAAGASPNYRIYLGGYGRPFGYYEDLARLGGGAALAGLVRRYGRIVLADGYDRPTRSAVWSLGAEDGEFVDNKLELCGHCVFQDDEKARERALAWLRATDTSTVSYTHAVDVLSGARSRTRLHAYLGVGANRGRPYSTFYFNPAATLG